MRCSKLQASEKLSGACLVRCSKLPAPELLRSLLAGVFVACKEKGLLFLLFAIEEKEEELELQRSKEEGLASSSVFLQ